MVNPLLVTKLHAPPLRSDLVPRARLIQPFAASQQRLILVSAPAGFGKTTLVIDWLARQKTNQTVWLSLDEQDNDAGQFLHLLIMALQKIDPHIGQAVEQALSLPQPLPIANLMVALVNDIAHLAEELVLVLDDLHLITDDAVQQIIGFMIDHLPQSARIIIITREDPPLPLARLRVYDQILEIREHDLRFTLDETAAFFRNTIKLDLPDESVALLSARTEGWAAGIQLAALALQNGRVDTAEILVGFSGSDRYVADYLMTEVLQHLPPTLQEFLQATAVLNRLSAPLCDALTGRGDSQSILTQLEAINLFVIPLDHQRTWYRYYRLFAEFLRARLDPAIKHDLHMKAMHWYEKNHHFDQAFSHAVAAEEYTHAGEIILQIAEDRLHSGGIWTLANRLATLPESCIHASLPLTVYKGLIAVVTGQIEEAQDQVTVAENHLQTVLPSDETRGQFVLLQTFIALGQRDDVTGIRLATEALQLLTQANWRVMALWLLAEAHERTGNIQAAINALSEARQIGSTQAPQLFTVMIDAFFASALSEHGQLQEAIAVCEQMLGQHADETGERMGLAAVVVYARLALLMLEANRLDEARTYFAQYEKLAPQPLFDDLRDLSQGIRARILAFSGESDAALAILRRCRLNPVQQGTLSDRGWLTADEMNLHLRSGDSATVEKWAECLDWQPTDTLQYLRIEEYLAYVHYLVQVGYLDLAEDWLTRLETFTTGNGLHRKRIPVHILQALAAARAGDTKRARQNMVQAVEAASPQGYMRVFLEYGDPVLELLPAVRHLAPQFVDAILNAAQHIHQRKKQPLADPLTEREIEVLGLIVTGLSNAEIAERLVISLGTVKRHINHIYSKLAVSTRAQAVIKAGELNLLEYGA